MTTKTEPLLHTMEEAAARLRIGITSVKGLIRRGDLHSIRIGRSRRITDASLVEYTQRLDLQQNGIPT